MTFESFCVRDTFELGKRMGGQSQRGQIYLLDGDLGVGKTVFTKGFAVGLGITEPVTSPTYTLVQEYNDGRIPFYHFDVYRIEDAEELYELGLDAYLFGEGVCLIEWASRIEEVLPDTCKHILIEKDMRRGFDYRKVTIKV